MAIKKNNVACVYRRNISQHDSGERSGPWASCFIDVMKLRYTNFLKLESIMLFIPFLSRGKDVLEFKIHKAPITRHLALEHYDFPGNQKKKIKILKVPKKTPSGRCKLDRLVGVHQTNLFSYLALLVIFMIFFLKFVLFLSMSQTGT
jgi:hypothetical protein